MNILILGGLGFLGRSCANVLQKYNNVYIVDRGDSASDNCYKYELSQIEKIISIINQKKIDCIMHFVSSLIPSSTQEQYVSDLENVYLPSVKLIEYCAQNKIKFVYLSSGGAVYGNQKEIFNERTKREPVSLYGLSKLNFENILQFYHNTKGLEFMIIRPSNPYGFGQNINGKQGLIAVIMGKIFRNEPIEIWGDGTAVKDYIHIDDFCFYVNALISNDNSWNDIYNIGSGVGKSVNDVIAAFRSCNIFLPEITYKTAIASDVKRMILDCTKLQDKVDHKCIELQDGINSFWEKLNAKSN